MQSLLTLALVLGLAAPAGAHDERRIRLEGRTRAALTRALEGARQRLAGPGCAAVLGDFEADLGFSLSPRLAGVSPADYLDIVVFADGRDRSPCQGRQALATTSPGSRVVYVCGTTFVEQAELDPELAQATLIHELLHSLGLPENPPGSHEITRRVLARCGDRPLQAAAAQRSRLASSRR
jgi:hypothetical protein